MKARTIFEKIWEAHIVKQEKNSSAVLYIDAHLIHEVTTPQAFAGLRKRGIKVFRTKRTFATEDHNVPTINQNLPIKDLLSRQQVETLTQNCKEFGIELYGLGHPYQGIVHVIGPELGITKPGMTIVCGDSHTSTHGAFGAIAFGIGTSEVEQVLATQCVLQTKPKTLKIEINGKLGKGVTSKDIILYIIAKITTSGAAGHFVEYTGSTIKNLSMEARMTICNMSIEMGARGGLIAPDEKTFLYIKGRKFAPKDKEFEKALKDWETLPSDKGAKYDKELKFDASDIEPMITYGTNPGMVIKISQNIPQLTDFSSSGQKQIFSKALEYMVLTPDNSMKGQKIDYVFIGSCTNARIEDLRLAASIIKGRKKAKDVVVFAVAGSQQVLKQAKKEGIDKILKKAGILLREPGCSACLAMNEDKIPSGKYCISTSNRNFEGRQGPGSRTFLASPLMAAAAAISGKIVDVREMMS